MLNPRLASCTLHPAPLTPHPAPLAPRPSRHHRPPLAPTALTLAPPSPPHPSSSSPSPGEHRHARPKLKWMAAPSLRAHGGSTSARWSSGRPAIGRRSSRRGAPRRRRAPRQGAAARRRRGQAQRHAALRPPAGHARRRRPRRPPQRRKLRQGCAGRSAPAAIALHPAPHEQPAGGARGERRNPGRGRRPAAAPAAASDAAAAAAARRRPRWRGGGRERREPALCGRAGARATEEAGPAAAADFRGAIGRKSCADARKAEAALAAKAGGSRPAGDDAIDNELLVTALAKHARRGAARGRGSRGRVYAKNARRALLKREPAGGELRRVPTGPAEGARAGAMVRAAGSPSPTRGAKLL